MKSQKFIEFMAVRGNVAYLARHMTELHGFEFTLQRVAMWKLHDEPPDAFIKDVMKFINNQEVGND